MSRRAAGPTSPSPSPAEAVALYAQPSDVMLLNEFLRPWVTSGVTKYGGGTGAAGAYVHSADLYSADPEELARRFSPAVSMDGERIWYFLSPLRCRSPRDRRKVRAVADGTGCWHSEAAPRNVVDHIHGGRHVGYRQSFSFMRRRDHAAAGAGGADARSGWIMAEFHLHNHDENGCGAGRKVEGLVLCKMYRSPRHHGPAAAPDGGDGDVASAVSLCAETTTFGCEKRRMVDGEDSNAVVTTRWQRRWHSKNTDDGVAMATEMRTAPPPLLEKKAAGDDEVSSTTVTAAPCAKNKAVVVVEDDEDLSLASPPACKKMRVAVADTDAESSGAALAREATAGGGAPAAEAQLHCPQCGFHLAALQALVTLNNFKSCDSEITRRQRRTPSHVILE